MPAVGSAARLRVLLKNGSIWFVDSNTDLTLLLDKTTGNTPILVRPETPSVPAETRSP